MVKREFDQRFDIGYLEAFLSNSSVLVQNLARLTFPVSVFGPENNFELFPNRRTKIFSFSFSFLKTQKKVKGNVTKTPAQTVAVINVEINFSPYDGGVNGTFTRIRFPKFAFPLNRFKWKYNPCLLFAAFFHKTEQMSLHYTQFRYWSLYPSKIKMTHTFWVSKNIEMEHFDLKYFKINYEHVKSGLFNLVYLFYVSFSFLF